MGMFWDKGIMLVDGCTKISSGCLNCWSEAMTARFNRVPEVIKFEPGGRRLFNGNVRFNLYLLSEAAKVKKPHVYAIWNDLYHEDITLSQLADAHNIMADAQHHTFLIVTKRPGNVTGYVRRNVDSNNSDLRMLPHIWHIVTCENQAMADERIPELLKIPGKRGIIMEPMLEGVNLSIPLFQLDCRHKDIDGCCKGPQMTPECHPGVNCPDHRPFIHQVILGPENGAGKRPFDPAWADKVKDQCEAAGVLFYRKDTEEGQLAWRTS
jgi:protein gp37